MTLEPHHGEFYWTQRSWKILRPLTRIRSATSKCCNNDSFEELWRMHEHRKSLQELRQSGSQPQNLDFSSSRRAVSTSSGFSLAVKLNPLSHNVSSLLRSLVSWPTSIFPSFSRQYAQYNSIVDHGTINFKKTATSYFRVLPLHSKLSAQHKVR